MATLSDVAALAGVSKATASRVFNKPDAVTVTTARRVQTAADQLGFVPNIAARQLARGRIGIVAIVVPSLDNQYYTPIISGAQSLAQEHQIQLTVAVQRFDSLTAIQAMSRLAHQADGFLVISPHGGEELIQLAVRDKPTVLVEREVDGLDSVIADTPRAFASITRYLAGLGHRRIAYLGGSEKGSWRDPFRREAVISAASEFGTEVVVLGPYAPSFSAGIVAAEAVNEANVSAVIPYATALGLGVQLRLISDNSATQHVVVSEHAVAEAMDRPDLPTIDVDGFALGRTAIHTLINRIEDPEGTRQKHQLKVRTGPNSMPQATSALSR